MVTYQGHLPARDTLGERRAPGPFGERLEFRFCESQALSFGGFASFKEPPAKRNVSDGITRCAMNAGTAQQYARCIGVLYLISIVAGGWGESHVPGTLLIANDLAGTAHKLANSVGLFRSSFAAYLIEAASGITLNVLLYALLRPVSRNLALLAACFGLMGTAVFAAGQMLYFAATLPAVDADVARVISPEAKATFTYLCLTIYGYGFGIFAIFDGIAAVVRDA
jgi:hypothetical protein